MVRKGSGELGRKPEHEILCFCRVKWLQATMKGTSCVRRLRLRSVYRFFFAAVLRWLQAALGVLVCA